MIPIWTALTLGIIPSICQEGYGVVFNLRVPQGRDSVRVSYIGRGPAVLGWAALFLNTLPNWSRRSAGLTRRYDDQVAAALTANAQAIRRLAEGR
jgi:hypothetical protein